VLAGDGIETFNTPFRLLHSRAMALSLVRYKVLGQFTLHLVSFRSSKQGTSQAGFTARLDHHVSKAALPRLMRLMKNIENMLSESINLLTVYQTRANFV
jgi:hypothetical protein